MKRNLLLLAVMAAMVLCFSSQSFAQDPNDLGDPDSLIILTCPDDHTYEAIPGSFDSVRCCVYVVHDSNTFWWEGGAKWVQDSVAAFVVPLIFWHQPPNTADSVIFPTWDYWNNVDISEYLPWMGRSMFRHGCSGKDNRMLAMTQNFKTAWTVYTDFESHSCEGDSGKASFSCIPMAGTCQKWWEGEPGEFDRVLLATLTFHVYMSDGEDTTEIGIDSTFWSPASELTFTRYDAVVYFPINNLIVKDTIYIIPCLPPNITCPDPESYNCSGTYTTSTKFNADDGNPNDLDIHLTGVTAVSGCSEIVIVSVNYDVDPPQKTLSGTVTYTVDHCDPGCAITLTATNNCAPPQTDDCTFGVTLTNANPTITCPGNVTGNYATTLVSGPYTAADECMTPTVTMTYTGTATNVPALVGDHVTWDAFCTESITVTLTATDDCDATATCNFTMTGTNLPPTITCPPNAVAPIGNPFTSGTFTTNDPEGGPVTVTFVSIAPVSVNTPTICGNAVCWLVDGAEVVQLYTITIRVTDECGLTADCSFDVDVKAGIPNQVKIPNQVWQRYDFDYCYNQVGRVELHDKCPLYIEGAANPGDFVEIPIILENFVDPVSIGSFLFEIEFDYIDLTFYGVERGDLLFAQWTEPYPEDPTQDVVWSWEYFSYRLCPCAYPGCLKYKIMIFGQAEMPDGLFRRGYCIDFPGLDEHVVAIDTLNLPLGDLVWLKFQIANNELLKDLKLPVKFEWEQKIEDGVVVQDWDCAENTMGTCEGENIYVSTDSIQFSDVCFDELQFPPYEILTFIDGGIHICSPCSGFKCERGDINLNHIAYDPGDPVLLSRAIIFGELTIFWDIPTQMCASDVNADGRSLMLADLIYLIRVIQNDAIPYPKLGPSADVANLIVAHDRVSVECASPIGGLLFVFDGAVTPTLLNTDMELLAHEGRVLVWSRNGSSINAGVSEILSVTGADLVSVTAVDRESRDLATTITTKVAPSAFALHAAYPNPFNPFTNLSFTLPNATAYSLKIYNVAGQLVRSYEDMGTAGLNMVTWNGKDNAGNDVSSGVYFFKLSAGIYNATSKMVLMK